MQSMTNEEFVTLLEEYEDEARSFISEGRICELEKPLRRWENILKNASGTMPQTIDYFYFSMVFHQVNYALYQKNGQINKMKEHILLGMDAAKQMECFLPMEMSPQIVQERTKLMAIRCAEFLRIASLDMETLDAEIALELIMQSARIYDWLWSDLTEQPSVYAVEVHLKLASLLIVYENHTDGARLQLKIVREKYLQLYERTNNPIYKEKSEHVSLEVKNADMITEELLQSNPALALVYRTARLVDLAGEAARDNQDAQAAFYYEKAAFGAEQMMEVIQNEVSYRIAILAYFGAVFYLKGTDSNYIATWAAKGLAICDKVEKYDDTCFTPKEIKYMRKKFLKVVKKCGGKI